MAAISNNNIARAIYLAVKEKSTAEQSLLFPKIVRFLARKKLLSKAPDILARLSKIINDAEGKVAAKISSVEKIKEMDKREIKKNLSKRYGGMEVVLEERLDEKILGGYRIEVNDEVIDLSMKNRIGKLQEYLTKSS
ncbi:MAG TPA: F0F1 ATP synthase subunit delta [Candidatus Paceibacterota bacterium]